VASCIEVRVAALRVAAYAEGTEKSAESERRSSRERVSGSHELVPINVLSSTMLCREGCQAVRIRIFLKVTRLGTC
jgi:hypothetical protein